MRAASTISFIARATSHAALTGAEQAALKVDLDGDGEAVRKFFNLSEGL